MEKRFVSRGGTKLEHALQEFGLEVSGKTALDIGASTGGFTDCLLQRGAAKVYAVDVGYGILDWKLRNDPRVVVMERTNARYLSSNQLTVTPDDSIGASSNQKIEIAVIDVSFIALSKILPAVYNLLADGGEAIALIKPQFEAKREEVPRGGIVKDERVRQAVIERVKRSAEAAGFKVIGLTPSPIEGAKGNVEYFIRLEK